MDFYHTNPTPTRYGRTHHDRCLCSACNDAFQSHNANGATCNCYDCQVSWALSRGESGTQLTVQPMGPSWQQGTFSRALGTNPRKGNHDMANIKMCERKVCRTMMTGNAAGVIQVHTGDPNDEYKTVELCPGCIAEYLTWFDTGAIGDRERAYDEPYTKPVPKPDFEGVNTDDLANAFIKRLAIESGATHIKVDGDND